MATKTTTYTWTFAAGQQLPTDQAGSSSLTFGYVSTGGQGGSEPYAQFSQATKGTTQTENAYPTSITETWETWGVPAGSTITQVQITSWYKKITSGTKMSTNSLSALVVSTGATTVHSAGDLIAAVSLGGPGTDTSWVSQSSGAVRAVDSSFQASNTPVALRMNYTLTTTGTSGSANVAVGIDSITLTITYTPPDTGFSAVFNNSTTTTANLDSNAGVGHSIIAIVGINSETITVSALTGFGATFRRLGRSVVMGQACAIEIWGGIVQSASTALQVDLSSAAYGTVIMQEYSNLNTDFRISAWTDYIAGGTGGVLPWTRPRYANCVFIATGFLITAATSTAPTGWTQIISNVTDGTQCTAGAAYLTEGATTGYAPAFTWGSSAYNLQIGIALETTTSDSIYIRQVVSKTSGAGTSQSYPSFTPLAGSTLIAYGSTAAAVNSLTYSDGGTNSWQRADAIASSGITVIDSEIWYAANVAASTITVTASRSGSSNIHSIIEEWVGLADLDVAGSGSTGNSTTMASGDTGTTIVAADLAIALWAPGNSSNYPNADPSNAFSCGGSGGGLPLARGFLTVDTPGNWNSSVTTAGSAAQWAGIAVAFKVANGRSKFNGTSSASTAIPVTTVGNTIIAAITIKESDRTVSTLTGFGATFRKLLHWTTPSTCQIQIWAGVVASSGTTLQASLSDTGTGLLMCREFANIDSAFRIDAWTTWNIAQLSSTGTERITPVTDNCALIGICFQPTSTATITAPSTPWSQYTQGVDTSCAASFAYLLETTATGYNPQFSGTAVTGYSLFIALQTTTTTSVYQRQAAITYISSSATSLTAPSITPVTNSALIATASTSIGTQNSVTVSDGTNTWNRAASITLTNADLEIWYAAGVANSAVAVQAASASAKLGIIVREFIGLATSGLLDVAGSGSTGTSATEQSGNTGQTVTSNDLIFAAYMRTSNLDYANADPTNGFGIAGGTSGNINPGLLQHSAYKIVSATSDYSSNINCSFSAIYNGVAVAFKQLSSGPITDNPQYWSYWNYGPILAKQQTDRQTSTQINLLLQRYPQTPPNPPDDPQYWHYWTYAPRSISELQARMRATDAARWAALNEPAQTPPNAPDNPQYWSYWQLTRTNRELLDAFRSKALLANQLVDQKFGAPLIPPDNPQYWDYWNILAKLLVDKQSSARFIQTHAQLIANQYPRTPPLRPDNPQYWDYWNISSKLQTSQQTGARLLQTLIQRVALQYPQTPPPAPDNPQYWAYWRDFAATYRQQVSLTAAANATQASLFLYQYAQTPPPAPDDPQYWAFWQTTRTQRDLLDLFSATASIISHASQSSQYAPTFVPPVPPDDPQYWAYWQLYLTNYDDFRTKAILANRIVDQGFHGPLRPPDNPPHWSFWYLNASKSQMDQLALTRVLQTLIQRVALQYPQTPPVNAVGSSDGIFLAKTWSIFSWRRLGAFSPNLWYPQTPPPTYIRSGHTLVVPRGIGFGNRRASLVNFFNTLLQHQNVIPPSVVIAPDDPQYWDYWNVISKLQTNQRLSVGTSLVNFFIQQLQNSVFTPSPPDNPQYWNYWDITARLQTNQQNNIRLIQTLIQRTLNQYPQTPPNKPDDPQYWDYWDVVARLQNDKQSNTRLIQTLIQRTLNQYPQTPPNKPDNPQYWDYWTAAARLQTAQQISTQILKAFEYINSYEYPLTPPPSTDNPQYWDYWNVIARLQANQRISQQQIQALGYTSLNQYAQTPPNKPDNPQYWNYWGIIARLQTNQRSSDQVVGAFSYTGLNQYSQTPPPTPDNPQYWSYWQLTRTEIDLLNNFRIQAILANQLVDQGLATPPSIELVIDNPLYWNYWQLIRTNNELLNNFRTQATLANQLVQGLATPPKVPDNPLYWDYWSVLARLQSNQRTISQQTQTLIYNLNQYSQTPPNKPDNPQYWSYWQLVRNFIITTEDFRAKGLLANQLAEYPQTPPNKPDNPQYWDYWAIAARLQTNQQTISHLRQALVQSIIHHAQTPPNKPDNPQYWAYWKLARHNDFLNSFRTQALLANQIVDQGLATPPPKPDNPQYWDYWNSMTRLIAAKQASSQTAQNMSYNMLNQYPQLPIQVPDNPQYWNYWQLTKTLLGGLEEFRIRGIQANVATEQTPPTPPKVPDNPQYWDYWNYGVMLNKPLVDRRLLASIELLLKEYPQTPPSPTDDPKYWEYWKYANTLAAPNQLFRNQALLASLLAQPPQTPPSPTDDPQYWAFWQLTKTLSTMLEAFSRSASFANVLSENVESSPLPVIPVLDNPYYWQYWQLTRTFTNVLDQFRNTAWKANVLSWPPQTPPNKPDNPQYWAFWQYTKWANDLNTSWTIRSLLGHQRGMNPHAPQRPPDNPPYFHYWTYLAAKLGRDQADTERRNKAATFHNVNRYQYMPAPKPDNPLYWHYWTYVAAKQRRDLETQTQRMQAALFSAVNRYQITPVKTPDDPQYWDYWTAVARLLTDKQARTQSIAAFEWTALHEYAQTPPPATDNPQYWDYWNLGAKLQLDKLINSQKIQTLNYIVLNQFPQTPPPKPDNPQYWAFWQLTKTAANTLNEFLVRSLFANQLVSQGLATPPAIIYPDDPQYWAFWQTTRTFIKVLDDYQAAAVQANVLAAPTLPTPPLVPDNPQYWAYWKMTHATTNILDDFRAKSLLASSHAAYPITPPPFPDTHQTWQYWLVMPTLDQIERDYHNQSLLVWIAAMVNTAVNEVVTLFANNAIDSINTTISAVGNVITNVFGSGTITESLSIANLASHKFLLIIDAVLRMSRATYTAIIKRVWGGGDRPLQTVPAPGTQSASIPLLVSAPSRPKPKITHVSTKPSYHAVLYKVWVKDEE